MGTTLAGSWPPTAAAVVLFCCASGRCRVRETDRGAEKEKHCVPSVTEKARVQFFLNCVDVHSQTKFTDTLANKLSPNGPDMDNSSAYHLFAQRLCDLILCLLFACSSSSSAHFLAVGVQHGARHHLEMNACTGCTIFRNANSTELARGTTFFG